MIDITDWVDGAAAVLEAWYPGEQGGTAIADVLTGKYNPGGRLPFSWVKCIGQNPMYYSIKPSGRNYSYVENDGKPLYPFGYGLSYTTFEYSNMQMPKELEVPYRSFHMWDKDMNFVVEEGWFEVWLGKNAENVIDSRRVYVKK